MYCNHAWRPQPLNVNVALSKSFKCWHGFPKVSWKNVSKRADINCSHLKVRELLYGHYYVDINCEVSLVGAGSQNFKTQNVRRTLILNDHQQVGTYPKLCSGLQELTVQVKPSYIQSKLIVALKSTVNGRTCLLRWSSTVAHRLMNRVFYVQITFCGVPLSEQLILSY